MIQLNIVTLTELTHLFTKELIHHAPSKILNVASVASYLPGPLMAVYYATKAYVLSFSDAIHTELKDKNVSVTALCPGPTLSGFQEKANYTNTSYIEKIKFPTSKEVAEYGYKKTMQGQSIAIHGLLNKMMIFMTRFLPRSTVSKVVYTMQKKRKI
jgi:short-subunit dehydrogenase